jgi:plasmid stabilization system protein ParE
MSRELTIRPAAEAEMAEAFVWYEQRVPGLGAEFLLAVDAVIENIVRTPEQFPVVHKSFRRALLRRFPYSIFFTVEAERLVVHSVFHAKRDPGRWQEGSVP